MAASATDKLMKVSIATATTLDAPGYTIGDTSITVASTSTWPTTTGITFAIDEIDANGDRVAGSYNEYVGVVSSGTSVTSVSHVNGTNQDYTAGSTTRVYIPVSEERENRIVDWGVVEHNQDGTHAAVTATSVATDTITEATAAAGVTIDGMQIKDNLVVGASGKGVDNTSLNTAAGKLGAAWASWVTTWGNLTIGNGTQVTKFIQIGKTVHYRIHVTFGSTTSIGGTVTFSPPVTANSEVRGTVGWARFVDASSTDYQGPVVFSSTTSFVVFSGRADVADLSENALAASAPLPWTTTDEIQINGTFEAA